MRWVWRTADYLQRENMGRLKRGLILLALKPLKAWEIRAAKRPDFYIANSRTVASRLHEAFGIDSTVIYPPIDTKRFSVSSEIDDYFITLSRLVPYKRIDLAVQACSRTGRRLKVIGDGPDSKRLRRMAGPTIEFLGRQPDEAVSHLVCHCKALIFPGEEDFGMAPLEVNAAGRPVVAFKGGGAAETIMPGLNGVFFERPTADSLIDSLELFESMPWEPNKIRSYAERFDSGSFSRQIRAFVERAVISYEGRSASSTNSAGNPDWKVFPAS